MKVFSAKRFSYLLILAICFVGINTVNAKEEAFYTNSYNVSFTEEQYEYFTLMFYEGYQDLITVEMFNQYNEDDMNPELVDSKTYVEYIPVSRATSVTSNAKSLKISRAAGTQCSIAVSLNWTVNPAVKSYDVMGAYLSGISLVGTPLTTVTSSSGSFAATEIQKQNSGFGVSIKLPEGSNISITQSYFTTKGGTVYASYQHATQNVTLAQSKNYTIGYAGLGHVFDFASSVWSKYDGMSGVYIDCN